MEPVNGRNPLVTQAQAIRLPMPGEIETEVEEDYEEEEWADVDSAPLGEAQSEDEQFAGVNRKPPAGYDEGKPKKRRHPPMPKTPKPPEGGVFDPPFEVLPDGTVTGPKIGEGLDIMPKGFDPPKGSAEAAMQIIYGKPPQK